MPRFQFSMWWLMVAVTVACVFLFLTVTFGDFVPAIIAFGVVCILPTPIVIVAIYSRGDWQAFAIGALIPWVTLLVIRPPAAVIWLLPLCALCGYLAAATRRWIEATQRDHRE